MSAMVRSLLVVAVLATTAAAQPSATPDPPAPAQPLAATPAEPVAPPAAPAPAQPSAPPAPPAPAPPGRSVMDDRWSVNLQFGWHTFTVQHAEKPQTTFGCFALSGR